MPVSRLVKPMTVLIGCVLAAIVRPVASQEQHVWFWFANCGAGTLILEIKLDGTLLYKSTIPICQATRDSADSRGESKKISFLVRPRRAIKWSGYQDADVTTKAGRPLNMDLWQSGADPGDLLLGVSVSDSHSIYMNTIHIAYPEKPSSTEIAEGLVISTHPVSSGQ
jgi:hypothetical protein